MASRFSQSTVLVVPTQNHHDASTASSSSSSAAATTNTTGNNNNEDADFRRDSETAIATTSSGANYAGNAATSMAYLPQTVVLCELRHDAFEAAVPAGPSDTGLVSKWRPKDRVSSNLKSLFGF